MSSLRKSGRHLSGFAAALAIGGFACSPASGQDEARVPMQVEKSDGSVVMLPYLRFDIADGVAVFASDDGGEQKVAAAEMTIASLERIAVKMPPVAGWLAPDKAYLCVRAVGAVDQQHEEEAAAAILGAANTAPALKERIALLQLHAIVNGVLKADHDRVRMEAEVKSTREAMGREHQKDLHYANRHAVNPLTGRDQKTPHMEWSKAKTEPQLQICIEREQSSKRELMLRLASCHIFARYCEISGRETYAKELDQLRAKVISRSPVTRDSEAAGLALLAWMSSRVCVHHHTGNNAALLAKIFEKIQPEYQVENAFKIILFDRPPEEPFKAKAVVAALSAQKLVQGDIGDGVIEMRLRNGLRETTPDLEPRRKVIRQLMPFIEEAIRMGSR
ncbi:hypothetical protein [Luteolibacter luteus]|uniref:Uncharacterized protein n=1 Tax=Luteolibacter luteus TaxID=2728835 RepID=A0A858RJG9_9BACT|nr:hypothetical protein [Luteolibacter luteus]QJE96559.1 hypothetical protein HHL09_12455 [Luteolibacter luteus]